jgi:hypothetical protein
LAGFKGILYIALLVLSAKLFEEIAVRLRQPPIFGYLIAGIVVGLAVLELVAACRRTHAFYTDSYTDGHLLLLFLPDKPGRNRHFEHFLSDQNEALCRRHREVCRAICACSAPLYLPWANDYGKLKEPLRLEIFRLTSVPEFVGLVVASAFIQLANPSSFQETVNAFVAPFSPRPECHAGNIRSSHGHHGNGSGPGAGGFVADV